MGQSGPVGLIHVGSFVELMGRPMEHPHAERVARIWARPI
jgi:hypothetical protein